MIQQNKHDGRTTVDKTGENNGRYRHGMAGTRIYKIWKAMRGRCNNHNNISFKYYGDIGITVCDEWNNDFTSFYNDMKDAYTDKLEIDRIDSSKGYYKENCRWVTREFNVGRVYRGKALSKEHIRNNALSRLKLSKTQVIQMESDIKDGKGRCKTCDKYGVHPRSYDTARRLYGRV